MVLASYATTCFVVAAISSYFLLNRRHVDICKTGLSFAMWAALFVIPSADLYRRYGGLMFKNINHLKRQQWKQIGIRKKVLRLFFLHSLHKLAKK